MRKRSFAFAAPVAALAVLISACGSSSSKGADAPTSSAAAESSTTAAAGESSTTAAASSSTAAGASSTAAGGSTATPDLKKAGCPDPMVIQTDWFPEADHGWSYQLLGSSATTDPKKGVASAKVGGITVEVRAGGPFTNFASPSNQIYQSNDVFMGYVDTGGQISNATNLPLVAVFASYDIGPQIIQWDPAAYPNVKTLADAGKVAEAGKVLVFGDAAYTHYLIGKGLFKEEQFDRTYDGSPKRFTTEKGLFQQGFLTNEPYSYENLITDWKKPVGWALVHDTGFQIYQSAIAVKPEAITKNADCLKAVIPMFQKSLVDYIKNPGPTNAFLTKYVTDMAQFWQISDALSNDAVAKMKQYKLVSDAGNGYIGDMDCARVQKLIDEFNPMEKARNVEGVKDGLKCEDIVNNSFIDKSISLGS